MRYKKPLLIETYIEFKLSQTPDPATILGRFPYLAREKFQFEENKTVFNQKIIPRGPNAFEFETIPQVQLFDQEHTLALQAHPRSISVHNISTYFGWKKLKTTVAKVHELINELDLSTDAVGYSTIDELVVPCDGFALGRYFNCDGSWIPTSFVDTARMCDLQLGQELLELDGRNQQISLKVRIHDGLAKVTLHSKIYRKITSEDPLNVIDQLHEESTSLFELLITDETRREMEEDPDHA